MNRRCRAFQILRAHGSGSKNTHSAELLKGYPPVAVFVRIDDGLVDDLLQLRVLQVVAHHHLQHLEQLPVGDVAVFVHVVDPEGDWGKQRTASASIH